MGPAARHRFLGVIMEVSTGVLLVGNVQTRLSSIAVLVDAPVLSFLFPPAAGTPSVVVVVVVVVLLIASSLAEAVSHTLTVQSIPPEIKVLQESFPKLRLLMVEVCPLRVLINRELARSQRLMEWSTSPAPVPAPAPALARYFPSGDRAIVDMGPE